MNFEPLCQQLGYTFSDQRLLEQALTHKSYANEFSRDRSCDNERFEFLGDAVLSLVISELLMQQFPDMSEGGLSKTRATLVSEPGLTRVARNINLGEYLFIGKGEDRTGGRNKSSILSDALEALLAAIYLDSPHAEKIDQVTRVIETLFSEEIPKAQTQLPSHDFKTELQEYSQKRFRSLSTYQLVGESGPDHQKEFEVVVAVNDVIYGEGTGMSKKQAEQSAAKVALEYLKECPDDLPAPYQKNS